MARPKPYASTTVTRFGVMLRVHRRDMYLEDIFKNLRYLSRGREFHLAIQADRPSAAVTKELNRLVKQAPDSWNIEVFDAPCKLVDRKENFMVPLQAHYEYLCDMADGKLDAAALWDDDFWLTKKGLRELKGHLDILDADRIECKSLFLWDNRSQANEAFPPHWQALVFRVLPGDRYPEDYIVHCPHNAAQGKHIRMSNQLRNAGYMDADDRRLTWQAYKKAGKIDAHTLSLVKDARLEEINEDGTEPR